VRRLPGIAALTLFLLLTVQAAPVQAQDGAETSLGIQLERSSLPELPDNVAARLTTGSGEPVAGASIELWATVEILGVRSASLGTAVTDATGIARLPISPRRPDYEIRAEYAGNELYSPAEATVVLSFPEDRVDPMETAAPASRLATLRTVMPRVMGIVVALLWIFFAAAVFYVVKTIHRHSTTSTQATLDNR
jgi:hypothetical protein